ncbi:MAG TPA: fatty acid desaturase [Polyangiaceae bacterium]|nr:fatty acid desaturase [Polyangiaceae bacterium]
MDDVSTLPLPKVFSNHALVRFAPHLLALLFPLNALAFVLTGPHRWWVALLFTVPVFGSTVVDRYSGTETRQPSRVDAWPFDALLVALSALQLVNVVLLGRMMQHASPWRFDTLAAMVVVGSSSAYSGIVVAHELIHRTQSGWRTLGRLLLATVSYEHFYTEHVRGHHVRIGTEEDPATARFGESFQHFYFRTVPAQFRSAWRLETTRLGDPDMPLWDPRLLRSRVVHGVVGEVAIAAAVTVAFGPAALLAHVLQAWWATRALEVVNYFEHWGLSRKEKRVQPIHSWDTHSRFTYFALTGLSRHADHHAFASRHYEDLRVWDESPKLPRGYLAMFPLVLGQNRKFQRLMTIELRERKLGPFAAPAPAEAE